MQTNASPGSRRRAAIPRGVAVSLAVFAERAGNAEVFDVESRRSIDCAAGSAVLNTGHLHPKVTAAVSEQRTRFSHTSFRR